jgi:hypothetical protein
VFNPFLLNKKYKLIIHEQMKSNENGYTSNEKVREEKKLLDWILNYQNRYSKFNEVTHKYNGKKYHIYYDIKKIGDFKHINVTNAANKLQDMGYIQYFICGKTIYFLVLDTTSVPIEQTLNTVRHAELEPAAKEEETNYIIQFEHHRQWLLDYTRKVVYPLIDKESKSRNGIEYTWQEIYEGFLKDVLLRYDFSLYKKGLKYFQNNPSELDRMFEYVKMYTDDEGMDEYRHRVSQSILNYQF